jgi:hypothetical protein
VCHLPERPGKAVQQRLEQSFAGQLLMKFALLVDWVPIGQSKICRQTFHHRTLDRQLWRDTLIASASRAFLTQNCGATSPLPQAYNLPPQFHRLPRERELRRHAPKHIDR